MMSAELENMIGYVQELKAETQTLKLKAAAQGCPTQLYDTLSGFSNQDEAGRSCLGWMSRADLRRRFTMPRT